MSPIPSGPAARILSVPPTRELPRLAAALAPARPGAPTELVGLLDGGGLVALPLTGADPVADVVGFRAPPLWWALGLVAPARVGARAATVRLAHLVDRDGRSATVVVVAGETRLLRGPGEGRVADVCRRALGLPTPPPPCDLVPLLVDVWLARVAAVALAGPAGWREVVHAHPAAPAGEEDDGPRGPDPGHRGDVPDGPLPTPAAMAALTRAAAASTTWEACRHASAERSGAGAVVQLPPGAAAWLDEGAFARWVLGESLPWDAALDLLEALVRPAAVDLLRAALCELPPPAWPPTAVGPG